MTTTAAPLNTARLDAPADVDGDLERVRRARLALRLRHQAALASLMEQRADLRGVHALADLVDDAVRWTA